MDDARLLEEFAQISLRLDNVEGYFSNFDITLNNHMTDYKKAQDRLCADQDRLCEEQASLKTGLSEAAKLIAKLQGSEGVMLIVVRWIIFPLIVVLAGLIGIKTLTMP